MSEEVTTRKGFSRIERIGIVGGLIVVIGYILFTYTSLGSTLMNIPLRVQPKPQSGLVGYWSFDTVYSASSTQEVRDDSGQGNHGNIINNASSTDITIDSSNSTSSPFTNTSPAVVFTSRQDGYVFFPDGDGSCYMASTTNGGGSWGGPTRVDSVNTADCFRVSVWYDGWTSSDKVSGTTSTSTKIHILTMETGGDDIYYTQFDTSSTTGRQLSDTVIIGGDAGSINNATNFGSITRTASSTLLATLQDTTDRSWYRCNGNCTTAANWTEIASSTINPTALGDDQPILVPVPGTGNNAMNIMFDASADDYLSTIWSATSSTWQASTTIDANAPENATYDAHFGATVDWNNNRIYLVYAADNNNFITADHDLRFASYNPATFAWTTANIATNMASRSITDAKVAYDAQNNLIYAVYAASTTATQTQRVFYRTSADNGTTWSNEFGPIDSGASDKYGGANVSIMGENIFNMRLENSGTLNDRVVGVSLTAPFGNYSFTGGRVGQGYEFDGVDDYVDAGSAAIFDMGSGDLSVAAWFKHTGLSGSDADYIITKGAQSAGGKRYGINIDTSDQLTCSLDDDATDEGFTYTGTTVSDNAWHHAACVRQGNTAYLYLDGVQVASNDITGLGSLNDGESMKIGASETNAGVVTGFFKGVIDEPRVYNRALGAEEVTQIYHIGATTKINTTLNTQPGLLNGLVGHWTFDGTDVSTSTFRVTSEVLDRSGNGNNGDWLNHASTTAVGRIGQAIQFDGIDDYVSITSDTELQLGGSDWSTSFWARTGSTTGNQFVINKRTDGNDKEYEVYVNAATRDVLVECENAGSGGQYNSVNGVWNTNEWFHVAVSYDGPTFTPTVYVNGALVAQEANTLTACDPPSAAPVKIGGRSTTGPFFEGLIDDVRLYNREITAAEAAELYRLGATSKINTSVNTQPALQSSLVGHYTFDGKDMPLGQVNDRSGSGNNGSYVAMASTTTYIPGRIGQGLNFNGSTQYVSLGASTNLIKNTSESSISLWAKINPAGSGTRRMIGIADGISNSSRFSFFLSSGNLVGVIVKAGDAEGGFTIASVTPFTSFGDWHHFAAVIDYANDTAAIYIDGVSVALDSQPTFTATQTSNTSSTAANVGTGPAVSNFWDGGLDDVRIYNRKLSSAEILDLYNRGK